jgi:hypothetical protein
MNSLDESSFAEVKARSCPKPWLADAFEVGEKYIRTRCGRIEYKFAGLRHNLDSIKSKARILLLWVDEAEPVSETGLVNPSRRCARMTRKSGSTGIPSAKRARRISGSGKTRRKARRS